MEKIKLLKPTAAYLSETADMLMDYYPDLLLQAGEWYGWGDGPNATGTVHMLGCSHTEASWWGPKADPAPSRVPDVLEPGVDWLCKDCVLRLFEAHFEVLGANWHTLSKRIKTA